MRQTEKSGGVIGRRIWRLPESEDRERGGEERGYSALQHDYDTG
jgi:hypothetical protein